MEKCFYCEERPATTGDHVVAQKRGGPDEEWNFLGCCPECNSRKGSTDLYTFLRITGYHGKWSEAKKRELMDKLASGLLREYINRKYVNQIKVLLFNITPKDIGDFDWGHIQPHGVGLKEGEDKALQTIAEIEASTKNNVTRTAIRYFLNEYKAGRINFQKLQV